MFSFLFKGSKFVQPLVHCRNKKLDELIAHRVLRISGYRLVGFSTMMQLVVASGAITV